MDTRHLFPLPDLANDIAGARTFLDGMDIIGLHAGARCGKDKVARMLQAHDYLYAAFATRGKAAAQHVFGLTREQTWNDDYKEVVIPHLGMTPREIFQRFLTEVCRGGVADDIWIRGAIRDAVAELQRAELAGHPYRGVVFEDVRIENEAAAVRQLGGTVWHLQRSHTASATASATPYRDTRPTDRAHASEAGVAFMPGDMAFDNTGTLDEVKVRVREYVAQLREATRSRAALESAAAG